jgi:hypothetical protein
MLCGRRFLLDESDEDSGIFCGLHLAHSGFHVAAVWFEDNDCTPWPTTGSQP